MNLSLVDGVFGNGCFFPALTCKSTMLNTNVNNKETNKLKIKLYIAICCRGNVDFTWKCLVAVKYKSTQSRVLCIGLVGGTSGSKELRASLGMFTRSCGSQITGFGHIAFPTCMAVMMMKINICICVCICLCICMYTKCSAQFLSGAYQRGCNADSQISESSR